MESKAVESKKEKLLKFASFTSTIPDPALKKEERLTQTGLEVERARRMIKKYQDDVSSKKPVFIDERTLAPINAFAIDKDVLDNLATLPGFSGIRLYLGINGTNSEGDPNYTLLVVPKGGEHMDNKDQNILQDGFIYDWVEPCPENCPDTGTKLP